MKLEKAQFQISNLLCFGSEPQVLDEVRPLNIIIGKNNSGKSTLLDAIHAFCAGGLAVDSMNDTNVPESIMKDASLCFRYQLPKESISTLVPRHYTEVRLGENRTLNVQNPIQSLEPNCESFWIVAQLTPDGKQLLLKKIEFLKTLHEHIQAIANHFGNNLVRDVESPLHGKHTYRIAAERDIIPEEDLNQIQIRKNGTGLTAAFQKLEHYQKQPEYLIKRTFLKQLNAIIQPDFEFDDVAVTKTEQGTYSIFFRQDDRFTPVGQLGSGLKTIMLVLANTVVLPVVNKYKLANSVFLFEELENNLHPSMLRRLLKYIRDFAVKNNSIFFITTHSSVVIDMFGSDSKAQIFHLNKPDRTVSITRVDDHLKKCGILDDLGNRASDILQCNGVVWVEGPSDVIYFNNWMSLWTDGELETGIHYQCVQYGGSNIATVGFVPSEEDLAEMANRVTNGILVNRNFIVLSDRDRPNKTDELKIHVQRIAKETGKLRGIHWITDGRDIENYLPLDCIRAAADRKTLALGAFERVLELTHKTSKKRTKTQLAEFCVESEHFTKENLKAVTGLANWLDKCVLEIKRWNGLI